MKESTASCSMVDLQACALDQGKQKYLVFKLLGVFIARGKEDALVTKNMVTGESVYGEKKVSIDGEGGDKIEYRVWNPFRSKLAAAILGGVDKIHIKPGTKVLYLGAASGTTVSHVSDIVGPVSGTECLYHFSFSQFFI